MHGMGTGQIARTSKCTCPVPYHEYSGEGMTIFCVIMCQGSITKWEPGSCFHSLNVIMCVGINVGINVVISLVNTKL